MKHFFKNQAGDTMVEVLIATGVISAILGGAYTLATSSLRSALIAQERTEAVKLVEGQIELLRFAARSSGRFDGQFRTANNYCIVLNADNQPVPTDTGHPSCRVPTPPYRLSIAYTPANIGPALFGTFEVRADWDGLRGSPERVEIQYQL